MIFVSAFSLLFVVDLVTGCGEEPAPKGYKVVANLDLSHQPTPPTHES
jgi:hypothetical protein